MKGFLQRLLNAAGLHTEAELEAARLMGQKGLNAPEGRSEGAASAAAAEPLYRLPPAEALFRRTAEDLAELPMSLQVQAKAQAVEKLRRMAEKRMISEAELEAWKRRVLAL